MRPSSGRPRWSGTTAGRRLEIRAGPWISSRRWNGKRALKKRWASLIARGTSPSWRFGGCVGATGEACYDGWEHFEKEGGPLAALNDRGEFSRFIVGNMEKQFVPVCVGNEASRQLCTDWFSKLMDLGAVGLEFDHQVGGYPSVCYSDQHGHPSGYGPWMHERMEE